MSAPAIAAGRRLSLAQLDAKAARIRELAAEEDALRAELLGQVLEYGFTPAGAEKSKRLLALAWQLTASTSSTTEINDAEVARIEAACPAEVFAQLFARVTKYKLLKTATLLLAATLPENAPRNLRMMFARAVSVKESSPRLRIEPLQEAEA